MEQSDPVATTKHPVRLADKIQKLGKRQEEAGKSSSEYALWGEALEAVQRYERGDIDSPFATFDRVSSAWLTLMAVESPGKKLYSDDFASFCVGLEAEYNAALKLSTPWQIYKRNVKAFTYHVGCPNAHEEPASNIAEMRRFHATQMPFFNKLQQDLAEQVKRNEYQQQIITHLLFRHLLEHLPLRTHPTNASENWMTFWKDACKKASDLSTTDHPLKQLLDLTPGSDHMFNTLSQVTNVRNQIAQWTKQGASYELGCGLYNITSKNIHNYAGDMDGYESAFKAGGHPWPKPLDDMLEALIPINFHPNNHASAGEVDWDKERARYL
ncbi:hypothetical protein B0A54_12224 [Friedmanniomyces endolithicus]|uniref:Uncharacterized protein n=1 Tax=Friedmanniomyces endolithicus TaxID=329885 RepID=A0A4U0UJX6_9PEZI|nr:hypothetical protein B0A54_12224 [Friedmanniomyces endolithicus]